jgi:FTR1 family protein
MVAFLRQTGHRDVLPYVHGGWIAALGAGVLTWAAATYLVEISGASREMMEGFGSVFAAGVLLWVGVWMHGKSIAEAWQRYICDKLTHALNGRSPWLLAGLSFLVVYREAFETILFYAAIWQHGNGVVVFAGGLSAVVTLLVIAWVMMRYSRALPIERFFAYSSALVAVLAVVLIGKGVAALQEAGYVSVHPLAGFPPIAALGLFPTREGIIASVGMIILLAMAFAYNRHQIKKEPSPTAQPLLPGVWGLPVPAGCTDAREFHRITQSYARPSDLGDGRLASFRRVMRLSLPKAFAREAGSLIEQLWLPSSWSPLMRRIFSKYINRPQTGFDFSNRAGGERARGKLSSFCQTD